jgi:hypothetical protein
LLRYGILQDDAPALKWQRRCLEALARVDGARLEMSLTPVADSVARARAAALDFILSFTDLGDAAGFVDLPRFGLWQPLLGDWINYRGEPGAFWEVYEGHATSAALLVRAHADPEMVTVLREVHLRTQRLSHLENREQLLERLLGTPAQACRELVRNGSISGPTRRAERPVRRRPTAADRARLKALIGARIVATGLSSLFRHDQWNVGIVDQPIADFLNHSAPPVRWLPPTPRSEFRADPFGIVLDGNPTILCEYYSYVDNRGFIVALNPERPAPFVRETIGPERPVHLSYPYLFEHEGRHYCVPESSEAQEITMFEIDRSSDRWKKVATLVTGRGFADASLFEHEGRWWMAASDVADKGANSELHLWFAADPEGPWEAHPGNPVKIDVRSARPGGTPFRVGGVLYRPAQDCSSTYGARIIINRVLELGPEVFREEVAATVDPDPCGAYPQGLHTLSAMGDQTLIDGKRSIFAPAQLWRVVRKLIS